MKLKIEIKNRWTGKVLFEYETENNTTKKTIEWWVKKELEAGKYRADLTDADLTDANLTRADLTRANLTRADLTRADLTDANLTRADLTDANLTSIKHDMFIVLLHGINEIGFLKQNIIDGNIDGSTYDGSCACLSGTLANSVVNSNGPMQDKKMQSILDCRDSERLIERFFMGIKGGDTPETSQTSKLALQWLEEFETLVLPLTKTNQQ